MTDEAGDLFPETTKPRGKTMAPEELTPPQTKAVHAWAERTVPWVTRGAFDSFTTVEGYIDETLEWWTGAGRMRKDWAKTIQNRIRTKERGRLERMARTGNESAKLALRQPEEWARRYDRKARATQHIGASGGEGLIHPAGGGKVIEFGPADRF